MVFSSIQNKIYMICFVVSFDPFITGADESKITYLEPE